MLNINYTMVDNYHVMIQICWWNCWIQIEYTEFFKKDFGNSYVFS